MKNRHWLSPKFIGEGFSNFLFQLHRVLLFSLYALLLSLPVVTAGGAHLALFRTLRRLAEDDRATSRDFFRAFREAFVPGIPYGLALTALLLGMSVPAPSGAPGLCLVAGCFLLYTLLLFYPAVFNAGYRGFGAFARATAYAAAHPGESLFLVGLAVLFLFAACFLSEILLLLFYPLTFFVTARIVIANNREEQHSENEEVHHCEKVS